MEASSKTTDGMVGDTVDLFSITAGDSEPMRKVLDLARRIAQSDATVLITGESGTGKELIARKIHEGSRRAPYPFVAVNCGAIPEPLLESELFGHVRGAFTGASQPRRGRFLAASTGTILLDEIGEMSPHLQVKLLRVLQERECDPLGSDTTVPIDARVIAATNCDLQEAIREGRFREDLFYRLSILPMELPPLRNRREDIPLLLHHFLKVHASSSGKRITITEDALTCLMNYHWPGNVRELQNLMERLVTLVDHHEIRITDLPSSILCPSRGARDTPPLALKLTPEGIDIDHYTEKLHRHLMSQALDLSRGNRTAAASLLGLNRTTFVERLRKLGLARVYAKATG